MNIRHFTTQISAVSDFTVHNLYFQNDANGKIYNGDTDNNRELSEMLYWSLEGAKKAWWRDDLKAKNEAYQVLAANSCTHNGNFDETFELTGCSVGVDHTNL